ncbi:hypothetical protein BHE74_00045826 [Ensete ventricosum]|nr:hypothetical protein BHE74_00045826 [Ensete ventricosum]
MHPLRFPNRGIRAKVFVQKIGFKLCMIRLNHVELLYALVAVIDSESRRCLWGSGVHMHAVCMQRWLATARPPTGATSHGLATCKGWPARKGLPPASSPTANKGDDAGRSGGRPLVGRLLAIKGSRRLRRGNDGTVRVKEG